MKKALEEDPEKSILDVMYFCIHHYNIDFREAPHVSYLTMKEMVDAYNRDIVRQNEAAGSDTTNKKMGRFGK